MNANCPVQGGMNWVTDKLFSVPESLREQIQEYYWEHDEQSKQHLLMVIGKNKKRAGKFFSNWELENCAANTELQAEVISRIIKLLDFVDQKWVGKQS